MVPDDITAFPDRRQECLCVFFRASVSEDLPVIRDQFVSVVEFILSHASVLCMFKKIICLFFHAFRFFRIAGIIDADKLVFSVHNKLRKFSRILAVIAYPSEQLRVHGGGEEIKCRVPARNDHEDGRFLVTYRLKVEVIRIGEFCDFLQFKYLEADEARKDNVCP